MQHTVLVVDARPRILLDDRIALSICLALAALGVPVATRVDIGKMRLDLPFPMVPPFREITQYWIPEWEPPQPRPNKRANFGMRHHHGYPVGRRIR